MYKSIYLLFFITFSLFNLGCGDDDSVNNTQKSNIYVWGENRDGQLGDGTRRNKNIPTRIANLNVSI